MGSIILTKLTSSHHTIKLVWRHSNQKQSAMDLRLLDWFCTILFRCFHSFMWRWEPLLLQAAVIAVSHHIGYQKHHTTSINYSVNLLLSEVIFSIIQQVLQIQQIKYWINLWKAVKWQCTMLSFWSMKMLLFIQKIKNRSRSDQNQLLLLPKEVFWLYRRDRIVHSWLKIQLW